MDDKIKYMICEKETYETQKSASKKLKEIWCMPNRSKKPIRYYQCEVCNKYHLTSKERL